MAGKGTIVIAVAAAAVGAAALAVLPRGAQEPVPLAAPTTAAPLQPDQSLPNADQEAPGVPAAPGPSDEPSPAAQPSPTAEPIPAQVLDSGDRSSGKVAITFDTSYSPASAQGVASGTLPVQFDAGVLTALEESKVPATVFVTGLWAKDHPEAMTRLASDPSIELGNHTFSHSAWTAQCYDLPPVGDLTARTAEVTNTAQIISEFSGSSPRFLRFPALCADESAARLGAELGHYSVGTDVATNDAFSYDSQATVAGILAEAQPGSIIALHLNGAPNAPTTAAIVRSLVPALRDRGLEPAPLAEVLGLPAAAPN